MNQPTITIVTPTYNRAHTLPQLFESLCQQTNQNFDWLIIDDGSSDNTKELCQEFVGKNFKVQYIYKDNGGKHTALNLAIDIVTTELFFIVDSDDFLTVDAIQTILNDWETIKDKDLCGISYLRGYSADAVIGDKHPKDHVIDNFNQVRFNQHIDGDKAEVWVTECLKEYRFPVFEGERFMGESWMWAQLAFKRDMLMVNKIIYITEYLEGGLSRSGRTLRIKCPQGGIENAIIGMNPVFNMSIRIKHALLFIAYSFFAHKRFSDILKPPYKKLIGLLLPAGWLLYKYWDKRFAN
ncbi:hypothetical protein HMPREF9332_01425 [Alloprevotella rava F0323]|uniref:Glycosyltransferase 2-like domain-containing protein n=1 Tax=Alloprevotella rava F0323 TaxID=679199 RepID=G5GCX1_9BACT|nr:glycosyltransferase family 2 protein [Alloprevotella rava]EHG22415.1 hypothetical protein HMPREF9332_01425 [Alloprevotella rava F0323]